MNNEEKAEYLRDLYLDYETELYSKIQELHPEAFAEGKFSQHWVEENILTNLPKLDMILEEVLEELDKKLSEKEISCLIKTVLVI